MAPTTDAHRNEKDAIMTRLAERSSHPRSCIMWFHLLIHRPADRILIDHVCDFSGSPGKPCGCRVEARYLCHPTVEWCDEEQFISRDRMRNQKLDTSTIMTRLESSRISHRGILSCSLTFRMPHGESDLEACGGGTKHMADQWLYEKKYKRRIRG